MMSIGEFARRSGLSPSAIRFYGDRGLLPAAHVDPSSGYRSYDDEQVATAVTIRTLRLMEMPLADIAAFLDLSDAERHDALQRRVDQLEQTVHQARVIAESFGDEPHREEIAMPETSTLTMPTNELGRALQQVLPASATSPHQPHLMSVLIESKLGSVRIAATDSHRLAVRDVQPITDDASFSATIAAATAATWLDQLSGSGTAALSTSDRRLTIEHDGDTLVCPLIPTTFPDYERVLSSQISRDAIAVDRTTLLGALDEFAFNATPIDLVPTAHGLRLQRGDQSIDLVADTTGTGSSVAVNPCYLRDAATHSVGPEIIIELGGPLDTIVCRSADDGTFTTMVMPVKPD